MKKLAWDEFTKCIHIHTTVEKLYWCWATKEGLTSWFLKDAEFSRQEKPLNKSEFIQPKDAYTWFWHNWDGKEEGEILETNGVDFFKFSFAGNCEVTVTIEQKEQAVLLSLTQSKIPLDEKSKLEIFYGCSNGWTFWLTNLKSYLEHGILLNETEINLKPFHIAGYEFVNM